MGQPDEIDILAKLADQVIVVDDGSRQGILQSHMPLRNLEFFVGDQRLLLQQRPTP